MRTAAYFGAADRVSAPARRRAAGRGLPQRIPPLPQRAMGETTLNKKMRAFDDEVALTVAPFYLVHMLQRTLPAGFIPPCLPTKTTQLPSGGQWLHEIKHDGFRVIARKSAGRVRLYSRPGNDLTRASSFQRPRNPPLLPPSKR